MQMLRSHKSLRTFLFMVLSGVIVDSMYLNSDSMFWLFKPLKKYRKSIKYTNGANGINGTNGTNGVNGSNAIKFNKVPHVCCHKGDCNSHVSQVCILIDLFGRIFTFCLSIFIISGILNLFDSRHRFGGFKICVWKFWSNFIQSIGWLSTCR